MQFLARNTVSRATALYLPRLVLTDVNGVYGIVRFMKRCNIEGIQGMSGPEARVEDRPLPLLTRSATGYTNLCRLLTSAHGDNRQKPALCLEELEGNSEDLYCLAGVKEGTLWQLMAERTTGEAQQGLRMSMTRSAPTARLACFRSILGDRYTCRRSISPARLMTFSPRSRCSAPIHSRGDVPSVYPRA